MARRHFWLGGLMALAWLVPGAGCGRLSEGGGGAESASRPKLGAQSAGSYTAQLRAGWNAVAFEGSFVTEVQANAAAAGLVFYAAPAYSNPQPVTAATLNGGLASNRAGWLFATGPTTLTYQSRPAAVPQVVGLQSGWNMVSFPTPATGLTVEKDGVPVPLGQFVSPVLYEIDAGSYRALDLQAGGVPEPGRAYWVFALSPVSLSWGAEPVVGEAVPLDVSAPPTEPDLVVDYPETGVVCEPPLLPPGVNEAVVQGNRLWPNGSTLNVLFVDGPNVPFQACERIATLVKYNWGQHANLKFQFFQGAPDANRPYHIRIKMLTDTGYNSAVGTDALAFNTPSMALSRIYNLPLDSAEFRRVVLHEFGHALGLQHEHQSPAAAQAISWNRDAVYQDMGGPPNNWSRALTDSAIFRIFATDLFSPLDPRSIMMYDIPARWTTNGFSASSNFELSELDRDYIRQAYPGAPPPEAPQVVLVGKTSSFPGVETGLVALLRTRNANGTFDQREITGQCTYRAEPTGTVQVEPGLVVPLRAGTALVNATFQGTVSQNLVYLVKGGASPTPTPTPTPAPSVTPSPSPAPTPSGTPGIVWTQRASDSHHDQFGVDYVNSQFVATGVMGLQSSGDGLSWTYQEGAGTDDLYATAFGNGVYLTAGGTSASQAVLRRASSVGSAWTQVFQGLTHPGTGLAFGNGVFVGTFGPAVRVTANGDSLAAPALPLTAVLRSVAFLNGQFVAVGEGGTILTAAGAATNWTQRTSGTTARLNSVAYGNGHYLAVGDGGVVVDSTDGVSWTVRSANTPANLLGIAFGDVYFAAVGQDGAIRVTDIGNGWFGGTSETTVTLRDVTFGAGRFVAVGDGGAVLSSP